MRQTRENAVKQRQKQVLWSGVVALSLGTVGATTEVAQAATPAGSTDSTSQETTTAGKLQAKAVALKTQSSGTAAGSEVGAVNSASHPGEVSGGDQQQSDTTPVTETEIPGTETPGTETPETKTPETETPETKTPETKTPETEAPETGTHEAGAPGTKTPEEKAPEIKAPEIKAPATEAKTTLASVPKRIKELRSAVMKTDEQPATTSLTVNQNVQNIQATAMSVKTEPAQSVDDLIPDRNLQQIVLFAIQQTRPEITTASQITKDLLGELTAIDMSTSVAKAKQQSDSAFYQAVRQVESLSGLEYAANLTILKIYPSSPDGSSSDDRGQLSNLSAISGLTHLSELDLSYNQIFDDNTEALANLTSLKQLNLSGNNITDLSFIRQLTNLTSISFNQDADSQYKIASLKPLAALTKLRNVQFQYNDIFDVSPLKDITVAPFTFSFTGNHIFDITPLLGLNWQPILPGLPVNYAISAMGQTWTLDQVALNPNTQSLSTWSFAYDNLHNFNEFMIGDPQSTGASSPIGAGNWVVWHGLTVTPNKDSSQLILDWDVSRHNDLTQPEAPNGLSFAGKIFIPYTLQAGVGAVTVAFQLDGGVKIAPFVILSGQTGSTLDVLNDASVQAAIAGLEDRGFTYEKPRKFSPDLNQISESSEVTYDSDAQNITLLFSPLQKIYLVDENGQAIGDGLVKESGPADMPWSVVVPEINGYTFDRVEGGGTLTDQTISGTIQDTNPDIYVYYKSTGTVTPPVDPPVNPPVTPEPTADGTVTVYYQTTTGESLAASQILTGKVGQPYSTTALTFAGQQLVSTPENATGVYAKTPQAVYYVYQTDEATTTPPVKPTTPPTTIPDFVAAQEVPAAVTPEQPVQKLSVGGDAAMVQLADVVQPAKTNRPGSRRSTGKAVAAQRRASARLAAQRAPKSATTLPQTNERHNTAAELGFTLLAAVGLLGYGWLRRRNKL